MEKKVFTDGVMQKQLQKGGVKGGGVHLATVNTSQFPPVTWWSPSVINLLMPSPFRIQVANELQQVQVHTQGTDCMSDL